MNYEMRDYGQLNLWNENERKDYTTALESSKVNIVFRNTIPEIPSTTYAVFSIYRYPAKFIPQVIAYIIKNYCRPGMKIFDPFAGYGTVGLVSRVYGYDYELWDLNPMLYVIHKASISPLPAPLNVKELIKELKNSQNQFLPNWSNLLYWFPEEFIPTLSKAWGYIHSLQDEHKKYILLIPMLKVTKYFSYADEKVHKLYKSKHSRKKVEELLKKDWENLFYVMLEKEVEILLKKKWEYEALKPKEVNYKIRTGIDTLEEKLEDEVNILITSPPYLQAQEYIRSTKLELFWLGYDENYIRNLSKKEIPYRDVGEIQIYSEKYYKFKDKIEEKHLRVLYQRYFNAILSALTSFSNKITDYMCIFVGQAKIRTTPIPIDDIIIEHMRELGWKHEITFVDKIVSRVMFESKINPASGREDSRIKTEHLVVLKRK